MAQAAAIFGCAGAELGADEARFFRDADPFGFILFARNVEHPAQLLRLTSALRDAVGRDAPVLVDQEGGRVQRLRAPHWREWLPPLDEAEQAGARAEDVLRLRYEIIGRELRAVGIDADCAPCADIAGPETHPFLRNRCLGTDPATVALRARAVAEGLLAGGVLPVMKHLPGHGRAAVDSHHSCPRVAAPLDELRVTDLAPFRALNDLPMAMTGHIVLDAVDAERPSTASPAVIALIRQEIGFDGLLMTDDLSMEALSGSIAGRAAAGIAAGCDIALHCNGKLAEMVAVAEAAGGLTPEARIRGARALARRAMVGAVDPADLDARFAALVKGAGDG
ncbi:MAG: hypothetical protein RLZZ528_2682 [Pseudomonadota bacterium]